MDYTHLMERAEEFYREVALEYYNNYAGLSDDFRLVEIVGKYPELFAEETYEQAMALTPDDLPLPELRELKRFVTDNLFTAETKELVEQKEQAEAALVVEYGDEKIPYRSLSSLIVNSANPQRRRGLDGRGRKMLAENLNRFYERIFIRTHKLTRRLGYKNYTEMTKKLSRLKLEELHQAMLAFIEETNDLYFERLEEYAGARLNLKLSQLEQCDAGRLFRATDFDEMFPAGKMLPALKKTLAGIGIDLDKQDNVTLDLEKRPKKSPRAFCIGILVPQDVRLVLSPIGGVQDYQTLFHEAGHLEFSAHMNPDLPILFRHEGDTSVHETFAFLFQYLVTDPVWLSGMLGLMDKQVRDYARLSRLQKLYFLRRYGAKLDYEMGFWQEFNLRSAPQAYAEKLTKATGFHYSPERYLADFDGGYYVAKYLQAWLAEAILRKRLHEDYGDSWYRSRSAGDFLRDIWRQGQMYDLGEVLTQRDLPAISTQPVLADIVKHLG